MAPRPDVKVAGSPSPKAEESSGLRFPFGPGLVAAAAAATVILGGAGALALTKGSGDDDAATVIPARAVPSIAADAAMRMPTEREVRKLAADRAARAARRDAAKRPVLAVRGTPPPEKTDKDPAVASAGNPVPAGAAQRIAKAMLPRFGFDPDTQFGCLVNLWNRESSWNVHAGSPGGSYGIPQANPGTKMASAGSDWMNSASTQIAWGLGYIKSRYGNPCGAWSHFQSVGSY